jgi:hypothetical protein
VRGLKLMSTSQFRAAIGSLALTCCTLAIAADGPVHDPLADLSVNGGNWGVWIDNGLVDPGEAVRITVSLPQDTPIAELPDALSIHPRYLEEPHLPVEKIALEWKRLGDSELWTAKVEYRPARAGNYFAAIPFGGHELFSYFAAWQKGMTPINFWMSMPVEYHDAGNLKDLYLPQVRQGHLPIDYELVLVGEAVFSTDWEPRDRFRRAQVETGAEVVPFFDGGYFHKLDPELANRFDMITDRVQGYADHILPITRAVHGDRKLPDPTFHPLTIEQCTKVVTGAQDLWKAWGFRPFTGVATYSPSNALIESCRKLQLPWLSGVFADYSFNDGQERWLNGWVQRHRGMPSFPYLASTTDFRRAGKADTQGTMIFPGWQNFPVWDHEDRHSRGSDPNSGGAPSEQAMVDRMLKLQKIFERNNELSANSFPLAVTFCIQMNNACNPAILTAMIDRARAGKAIFVHKRYVQEYFRSHDITFSPDVTYDIPDAECFDPLQAGGFTFRDEAVWEGAHGKAAFISDPSPPLPAGRNVHLPVWWYDFGGTGALAPDVNIQAVDLSGVSLAVADSTQGKSLIIQSKKALAGLPICLWELGHSVHATEDWIRKYNALPIAAPERLGAAATTWIIRVDVGIGETSIPLPKQ